MVKIAPSLLAANSAFLGREISELKNAHANYIHFDVMDGHFVPNLTFGPKILKDLKKNTSLPFDVHLMVSSPAVFIPWYAEAGADVMTFHLETASNPNAIIKLIKSYSIKAGITLRPESDINMLCPLVDDVDLILVMGVNPGFGGQPFMPDTLKRIERTKQIIGNRKILLEVDGGVTYENARLCAKAGADILVAGTAVFNNRTYTDNIKKLKEL